MTGETLFHEALARPAAERAAFLDAACAGQPQLRAVVEQLLAAHEASVNLLDQPPPMLGQTVDAEAPTQQFAPGEHTPQIDYAVPQIISTEGSPQAAPGLVIVGRYTLVEKIGEGGMGEVWVAQQTEPVKRQVALKLIKAGMDSKDVLARFEQERQALAMMDHPNIARVLDGGLTPDRRPFFVMEFVKGSPLTRFCDQAKLTPRARLDLFVPICQAVQHAHQKGIVHRDLKPANILVTLVDGKPVPKVIDFGVAKATAGKLTEESLSTQMGAIIGTLEYMSPEQAGCTGEDIDTRADIYSLGVILYELLTGLRPIEAKRLEQAALIEVIRIIWEDEPARPSTRLATDESRSLLAALRQTEPRKLMALLRGELDWVVMKCLEKQRDRRYETANGLARDIQRYLADEPVEARPPSARYRLGKFLRRNKGPVLAVGLVFLALLAGILGTTWGLIEAQHRAKRARDESVEKEKARLAEAEHRVKAEKARDRALQVLDDMTTYATGVSLSTQKELSPEQKKFLSEVLTYYQEFAREKADDEPSRARTAEAAWRIGAIENRLGRHQEAVAAYRQARERYEQLAADFPGVPKYRQSLATIHNNLGLEQMVFGQWTEAEAQYRQGLRIQQNLIADFPATRAYRQELARSHNNLGTLLQKLGRPTEAEEEYRLAMAIKTKLVADFPREPDYSFELIGTHINLGSLLDDQGRLTEAEEEYRQAMVKGKKLADAFPAQPEYRLYLARSHGALGAILRNQLGKLPEAEEQFREVLAILNKLVATFPNVPEYDADLTLCHHNLGIVLGAMTKVTEAVDHFHKSLAISEKLIAQFPTVVQYQLQLGATYRSLGSRLANSGRLREALGWFEKAIRTLTVVHERNRQLVEAKEDLAIAYAGRAWVHDRLENYPEASKNWDKAIEFSTPARQSLYRASRVVTRVKAGQVDEAAAEAVELARAPNGSPEKLYDLACVCALASGKSATRKAEYADRAMVLLQRAAKAGYHNAAHMAKDTDLDPLRDRDDFKNLMKQLQKK